MPVDAQVQLAARLVHTSGKVPEMHVPLQIPTVVQTPGPLMPFCGWQKQLAPPRLVH